MKPRFCGRHLLCPGSSGTEAACQRRQHYKGERDGLSDPEVLMGMIKVINPEYQEPREGAHGKIKRLQVININWTVFAVRQTHREIETFDLRVKKRYQDALKRCLFCDDFPLKQAQRFRRTSAFVLISGSDPADDSIQGWCPSR